MAPAPIRKLLPVLFVYGLVTVVTGLPFIYTISELVDFVNVNAICTHVFKVPNPESSTVSAPVKTDPLPVQNSRLLVGLI